MTLKCLLKIKALTNSTNIAKEFVAKIKDVVSAEGLDKLVAATIQQKLSELE